MLHYFKHRYKFISLIKRQLPTLTDMSILRMSVRFGAYGDPYAIQLVF
jgi:hypothetical protein